LPNAEVIGRRLRRATMQSAADHFRIWQTHLFAYSLSYMRYNRHDSIVHEYFHHLRRKV